MWSWFSSCCEVRKKKCEKRIEKAKGSVKASQTQRSAVDDEMRIGEELRIRPCYCDEIGMKPVIKKPRKPNSKLFCCSCFNKFWKKRSDKKKSSLTSPCNRYLCLHNPGRSVFDEPVPCVKCTHNCKARYLEKRSKKVGWKIVHRTLISNSYTISIIKNLYVTRRNRYQLDQMLPDVPILRPKRKFRDQSPTRMLAMLMRMRRNLISKSSHWMEKEITVK